jgi:hypoxanthine phosphoribosyltransferase
MCHWWKYWITSQYPKADVHVHDIFERYWPKTPSHLTSGWRDMDEQFDTLGVYSACRNQVANVDFVIIVDDVVTSGSHMNAIASFLRTAKLVNESAVILGYALYKTLRMQDADDPDIDWDDVL